MSTPVEIKKIAREYAMQVYPKEPYEDIGQMEFLRDTFVRNATKFISLLSKDYCIVPKELIRKEYEKAKSTHDLYTSATCINEMESRAIDHAEGRMCELTTLFGELFNEES